MPQVKLIALDPEDLTIVAAHLQDALAAVGDMAYLPREQRFVVLLNRYDWADADGRSPGIRRRAALRIDRVQSAQVQGIDVAAKGTVVNLLTALFEPDGPETPAGLLTLVFAGQSAVRLHVECLELQLEDLGPTWAAKAAPNHE
jgi:Protein of unknown function (DUF2948)